VLKIKKITSFNGHAGAVYKLIPANEKHLFYSVSSDRYIARWDLQKGEQDNFAIKLNDNAYTLHSNQNNLLFCGTTSGSVLVFDLDLNKEIKNLKPSPSPIFSILFINETKTLIVGDGEGSIHLYNSEFNHQQSIKLGDFKIRDLQFLKNQILIACGDGFIRLLSITEFNLIDSIKAHQLSVNKLLEVNGKIYSGSRDAHLNIWNSDFLAVKSLPLHNYAIYDLSYNPQLNLLASASRDKTIKIINPEKDEFLVRIDKNEYDGHTLSVNTLLWTDYYNILLSAGDDRGIIAWEINKETL
jgi:WD40 repeat protein